MYRRSWRLLNFHSAWTQPGPLGSMTEYLTEDTELGGCDCYVIVA